MKTGNIEIVGDTLRLPNKTTTEMNAISAPEAGMTVWNTTADALYNYDGAAWVRATTDESNLVHRTGDETIEGIKTFYDSVLVKDQTQPGEILATVDHTTAEVQFKVETDATLDGSRTYIYARPDLGAGSSARLDLGNTDTYISMQATHIALDLPTLNIIGHGVNHTDLVAGAIEVHSSFNSGTWLINGTSETGTPATSGYFHISTDGISGEHQGDQFGYESSQLYLNDAGKYGSFKTDYFTVRSAGATEAITANAAANACWQTFYGPDGAVSINAELTGETFIQVSRSGDSMKLTQSDLLLNGASVLTRGYNHTQGSAAVTWTVTHNLGLKPVFQAWDSTGAVINGTIQHVSNNQLTITFATAQSGAGRAI